MLAFVSALRTAPWTCRRVFWRKIRDAMAELSEIMFEKDLCIPMICDILFHNDFSADAHRVSCGTIGLGARSER